MPTPFAGSVRPEPTANILTIRIEKLVLDSPEALEQLMVPIEAGFRVLGGPCYVLLDITHVRLAPHMRAYLEAWGNVTNPLVRELVVFSRHPNPITELLLRAGAEYTEVPYSYHPDEAAARAHIAAQQQGEGTTPDQAAGYITS